jgi:outer membrane protein OmpA-like peptidoglycan-associated protein
MLDDLELQQVQELEVGEDQVLAYHQVPGLEGDFHQGLGRRAADVALRGVLTGAEAGEGLQQLREKFRAAKPVPFVSDITTATRVDQVLIEDMRVRELAGRPSRFEYAFGLREFTPAPPQQTEPPPAPPPPPPLPPTDTAVLEVEVVVEGRTDFDFGTVRVTVEGTADDGTDEKRTLTNRKDSVWTEEKMPPGSYTVTATVTEPEAMSGSTEVQLPAGQTRRITITLRPGAVIAKAFVVHFRFDNAFVEPCMRAVLQQAAKHAAANPDQKLVIVGHTDKTGPLLSDVDPYNQSLSERRARSVFAYLTSGRDQAAALAEWRELRQPSPAVLPRLRERWGAYQYQYMLQDLGFYPGNIDGDHGNVTDDAVRAFRQAKGLPAGTDVDDPTFDALIEAYLAQDKADMVVPEGQFLPNASGGCDGGILKWLGCGEESPLPLPKPPTEKPFRPYRRVELLFVLAEQLPCQVPQPDTFNLPAPGSVAPTWCLGPGRPGRHCCFATRECASATPGRWCIVPAEPDETTVSGSMRFEDGSPVAAVEYVLIAPDGEYMDGEHSAGPKRGEGITGRTGHDGKFGYPGRNKGVGVFTLEVHGRFVARLATEPPAAAKGNVVCARLENDLPFDLILTPTGPPAPTVTPIVELESKVVVVKKSYTSPARKRVTLRTDAPFTRTGTLTRSGPAVRFFTAGAGGTEIVFDGTDNVFTGAQLSARVELFAEGVSPSAFPDDLTLTLTLAAGSTPVGPPATATMTSVELTLDIFQSRTADALEPLPLPQPPAAPPGPGAGDKWFGGRFLHVQDPGNHHGRALLVVRQPKPATFAGDLVLRQVRVAADTPGALDARVQVFDNEFTTVGDPAKANPHELNAGTVPPAGLRLFAEGRAVSAALRDTGYQLGVKGIDDDGDRVRATVVQLSDVRATIPSTQPNTPRLVTPGVPNGPVPQHSLPRGPAVPPVAADFTVDFAVNQPLALVEGSLPIAAGGAPVDMSVRIAPAGVPVSWSVQRDTRPPPDGDHPSIVALSPNPLPALVQSAVNPLQATLLPNAVGSFHVRPFVDANGNGQFDAVRSAEPFIIRNLVLIRVGGPGSTNSSRAQAANIGFGPPAAGRPAPGSATPVTAATGVLVVTGNFVGPGTAGVHNDATVVVIGGGGNGRRGLEPVNPQLFAGWVNNEAAVATSITVPPGEDVVSEYVDTTVAPPATHRRISIWAPAGGPAVFPPGGAAPVILGGPVLDTTNFGNEGTGGNRAVGTEGGVGPPLPIARVPLAVGETWRVQMWDSPGDNCPAAQGFLPGRLSAYRFNLDFATDLVFWTNVTRVPGPTPAPIIAPALPTPDAACCLYSSVQRNTWQIRILFTFPAAGPGVPNAGNTITLTRDANPIRLAVPLNLHEVRAPVSLNLLATDARA